MTDLKLEDITPRDIEDGDNAFGFDQAGNPIRTFQRAPFKVNGGRTLLESKAINFAIGDDVSTTGYTTENDGGGGNYIVVGPTTGTDDGVSYINMANLNQFKLITNGEVRLEQGGATGTADDTVAFQAVVDFADVVIASDATYIVSSIGLSKTVTFKCSDKTVFKRKEGLDIAQSNFADGAVIFDVLVDGINVSFTGSPTFDGNKQNQPVERINPEMTGATTEPTGWSFRYFPKDNLTATDSRFYFERPKFINGTAGYMLVRGDDTNRRFRTEVILDDPKFSDSIAGYGKGDPATPSALGWNSDYIQILDYVELFTSNMVMEYLAIPTPTGSYAPVGLRVSFGSGSTFLTSGRGEVTATGTTQITGLGRKTLRWDGGDYVTNNGIGAIDAYGDGEFIFIEKVIGLSCENVPVRAKATINNYTVLSAILTDCARGLQISPSTSGTIDADVYIGEVYCIGGINPQIELVGNSTLEKLNSVHVGTITTSGGVNTEGLSSNIAGVVIRNVKNASCDIVKVTDQDDKGIDLNAIDHCVIGQAVTDSTAGVGVQISNCPASMRICGGSIVGTVGAGINVAGACEILDIGHLKVDDTIDYGIFANNSAGYTNLHDMVVTNTSGLSRAFFIGTSEGTVHSSRIGAGTTTGIVATNLDNVDQYDNNFTATKDVYKNSAPTTGTWLLGSVVWSTLPVAGGTVGFICTVAGTPGTWKTWGNIGA